MRRIDVAVCVLLAAVLAAGCVSVSDQTFDSHQTAPMMDNRVASVEVIPPPVPEPMEGESEASVSARVEAWRYGMEVLAEAVAGIEMPTTIAGVTISDIWAWWDQTGSGSAETRAKGEAAVDAAVAAGGSQLDKQGGTTKNEGDTTETRTTNKATGDTAPKPKPPGDTPAAPPVPPGG